mmetsp:Transcript_15546/g.23159  ORF Transcript_15546/g.23159 Transcript_15546/m.23159 type:complete len:255 (+) Transcript_15546:15-779(+)|eukprot:CAMPEP_0171462660 /NCGR_PEP_ID=MMETSP0945-20130129/6604_1 /TAXON_ID=109269 /ORGANISM="Vaucheria litorea, Strain CCMP2940" /LENGTH=254 /DNA_ID=CAMNT_0011989221 /DNA_START=9 /DNA_END=773 /DNA_ORIENTATION=+
MNNFRLTKLLALFAACFLVELNAFALNSKNLLLSKNLKLRTSQLCMSTEEGDKKEKKSKVRKGPTWMYNRNGVAFAPWMVDTFDQDNLDKIEAALEKRRIAKENEVAESVGDLARDPQAMELSGLGLNLRCVKGEVELEWKTGDERKNQGFIVSKRAGKTNEWLKVASYEDCAPLNSKGPQGGVYTFIDPNSEKGTWIYRVSDVGVNGEKNDLCQALIEVQDESEAIQAKIAVAAIGLVIAGVVFSAFLIDPMQ